MPKLFVYKAAVSETFVLQRCQEMSKRIIGARKVRDVGERNFGYCGHDERKTSFKIRDSNQGNQKHKFYGLQCQEFR